MSVCVNVLAKTGRRVAVDHTNVAEIRNGILERVRRSRSEETHRTLDPWADATMQAHNIERTM